MFPGYDSDNLVTTTLLSAIDFVMALEIRERTASPESRRDPSIVDERMGDTSFITETIQSRGCVEPVIRGPSTGWVKLAEGEDAIPPATPLVWRERMRLGLGPPLSARRRKVNMKENQPPLKP